MEILKAAIESLETCANFYVKDLEAMSEEQILGTDGGAARKPVDFTYEVAYNNVRIAARREQVQLVDRRADHERGDRVAALVDGDADAVGRQREPEPDADEHAVAGIGVRG